MSIKVLVTLGPASLNKEIVGKLADRKVNLFRINLSHTKLNDLESIIRKIQSWTEVPICLDSEGAQIRNQDMVSECVHFKAGSVVKIHHQQVVGDEQNISFSPQSVSKGLKVGDIVSVDFNAVSLKVVKDANDYLLAAVENDGIAGSNKAAD